MNKIGTSEGASSPVVVMHQPLVRVCLFLDRKLGHAPLCCYPEMFGDVYNTWSGERPFSVFPSVNFAL